MEENESDKAAVRLPDLNERAGVLAEAAQTGRLTRLNEYVVESVAAGGGCCISLGGVLGAGYVHHGVRPLAGLGLRLLDVRRPWLGRLLLLLL